MGEKKEICAFKYLSVYKDYTFSALVAVSWRQERYYFDMKGHGIPHQKHQIHSSSSSSIANLWKVIFIIIFCIRLEWRVEKGSFHLEKQKKSYVLWELQS